jgi:AcrR family transcriptional regulator
MNSLKGIRNLAERFGDKSGRKTRGYNSESRRKKSQASRQTIIETLVKLLVERKGAPVTFEEIAKASGVSVRSVYRFFKDKETLHEAMDEYLFARLTMSEEHLAAIDIEHVGRDVFALFDKHEQVTLAYLYSPFGIEARKLFRKRLNESMRIKILERKQIEITPENEKKLALIISIVNAKLWHDIRTDTGYSGVEMGPTVDWAVLTLINNI